MRIEKRRSVRKLNYLPCTIYAIDTDRNIVLAGPFSSRIINISTHGTCLLLSQIIQGTYHIFHSTMNNGSYCLQLAIDLPPSLKQATITARPVWINLFRHKKVCAYKIGIIFVNDPQEDLIEEIKKAMEQTSDERKVWLEGVKGLFRDSGS